MKSAQEMITTPFSNANVTQYEAIEITSLTHILWDKRKKIYNRERNFSMNLPAKNTNLCMTQRARARKRAKTKAKHKHDSNLVGHLFTLLQGSAPFCPAYNVILQHYFAFNKSFDFFLHIIMTVCLTLN